MTAFEAGRLYGIKQAAAFLIELEDQPTMAEEMLELLSTRHWRKRFREEYEARYGLDLLKRGFTKREKRE